MSDPATEAHPRLRPVRGHTTDRIAASANLVRIKVLSVASLIGEAIRHIHVRESVGGPYSPNELQLVQEMLWWDETVADAPNMVAFAIAQVFMSDIAAAVAAVARSTAIKFVSLDRFAFRSAPP